jgi:hypothetical protein
VPTGTSTRPIISNKTPTIKHIVGLPNNIPIIVDKTTGLEIIRLKAAFLSTDAIPDSSNNKAIFKVHPLKI